MSAQPARTGFGISEVLAQLRGEFPDVSVSKIRFLESEGLIQPARSPSNYRRFGAADVARLRYILSAQRDEYLPLRVIKDRLAAADGDAGADPDDPERRAARRPLSRRELLDAAGIDESYLAELEDFGLVRASGRQYGPDAVAAAQIIVALGKLRRAGPASARGAGRGGAGDRAHRTGGGAHACGSAARARGTGPPRRPGRSRRCPCSCTRR